MEVVEEKLLEALLGDLERDTDKQTWIGHLRKGWIDDRIVTVEVPAQQQQPLNSGGWQPDGLGGHDFGGAPGDNRDIGRYNQSAYFHFASERIGGSAPPFTLNSCVLLPLALEHLNSWVVTVDILSIVSRFGKIPTQNELCQDGAFGWARW